MGRPVNVTIYCPYCRTAQIKNCGTQSRCINLNCSAVLIVNSDGKLMQTYPGKIK